MEIHPQTAGVTFIKFYLITILLVGIPSAAYLLAGTTFPKSCEIMDKVRYRSFSLSSSRSLVSFHYHAIGHSFVCLGSH